MADAAPRHLPWSPRLRRRRPQPHRAQCGGGSIERRPVPPRVRRRAPWAHLDIAGTAFSERDWTLGPRGARGCGVRTLLTYLRKLAGRPAGRRRGPSGVAVRAEPQAGARRGEARVNRYLQAGALAAQGGAPRARRSGSASHLDPSPPPGERRLPGARGCARAEGGPSPLWGEPRVTGRARHDRFVRSVREPHPGLSLNRSSPRRARAFGNSAAERRKTAGCRLAAGAFAEAGERWRIGARQIRAG